MCSFQLIKPNTGRKICPETKFYRHRVLYCLQDQWGRGDIYKYPSRTNQQSPQKDPVNKIIKYLKTLKLHSQASLKMGFIFHQLYKLSLVFYNNSLSGQKSSNTPLIRSTHYPQVTEWLGNTYILWRSSY
jgi:hypothetical protein